MKKLLELKDVAKRLGCGHHAVIRLVKDRKLDAIKFNQGNYSVDARALQSFLRKTKMEGVTAYERSI